MGEAVKNVAEENATVIGQISQLLFEGEHLPTRQDHVNDTVIVFAKNGSATGKTTKAIDEPNGEQRQQGTKDFTFTGSYDAKAGVLSGTYTITVKYTIAGGGMPQRVEHEYTASGTLKMTKGADGVFKGTAEGDYTLDEVYSGGDSNPAPKKESGDVTWVATAVPQ